MKKFRKQMLVGVSLAFLGFCAASVTNAEADDNTSSSSTQQYTTATVTKNQLPTYDAGSLNATSLYAVEYGSGYASEFDEWLSHNTWYLRYDHHLGSAG